MADGASNSDTMAVSLSELLVDFDRTDRGRCVDHVLHLSALHILNPFDAKPGQLERALADAARELDAAGEDLTSIADTDDEGEMAAGQEEKDERHFRNIAAELASELSADEHNNLAAACLPGAMALTKVRNSDWLVPYCIANYVCVSLWHRFCFLHTPQL